MANTADQFLEGVKRRVTIPASQVLLQDTDILAFGDDAMQSCVLPLMMSIRQEYFVTKSNTATVANQAAYSIPYRAIGRTLRDIKVLDSAGTSKRDLNLIAIEDEHMFATSSEPTGFYFFGDQVVLVPAPTNALQSIEMWWYTPPGKLVKVDQAARILSVGATTCIVSSVPSVIMTGSVIDFIQGISGNRTLGMDKTISNISGTTISFASGDIPSGLSAGDYISIAETSPVLQLPNEASGYLETETCFLVLKAIGDMEGAKGLQEEAADEIKNVKIMLEPRIVGESTKIINRRGLLRGSRNRFSRGFNW